MTLTPKKLYIDKLDNLVNKCKNTFHRTIKLKPIDIKLSKSVKFSIENNDKDSKLKNRDRVGISKYKTIFAKLCIQIDLKKFLFLKT